MSSQAGSSSTQVDSPSNSQRGESPPPVALARPFRSRKNRPCDGCRRAKTRCAILEVGTPCVECQHTRKKCTFDEQPQERKRPVKRSLSPQQELTIDIASINAFKRSRTNGTVVAAPTLQELVLTRSDGVSLEETRGYHLVTAVLTDDLLPVGARKAGSQGDEHIRQISLDATKPQYVIFSKTTQKPRPPSQDPLLGIKSALSLLQPPPRHRALLELYTSISNTAFPILPPPNHVFANSQTPRPPSSVYTADSPYPLPLIPKILTAALNHAPRGMYRQSVKSVRKVAQGSDITDSGLPHTSLSSISDALLDISARPTENAEDCYIALAKTIAQAQLLGLHIDCSNWGIPSWEKDFRRTLWWALRVHDGWASFLNSRPSHIQINNHNVPLPTIANVLGATQVHATTNNHTPPSNSPYITQHPSPLNVSQSGTPPLQHGMNTSQNQINSTQVHAANTFLHLCRLAIFVSRLQTQVCTLMVPKDERLGRVIDIEREVEELLQDAREMETDGAGNAPGFASLMTCILGFRCMIRRIAIELSIGLGSPFTPDPETLERYAQAVDYISSLDSSAFDDFWLVHVGHILSSMTSSLIRLSLATTNAVGSSEPSGPSPSSPHHALLQVDARTNPIFLLCRLRQTLQSAYDHYHWDLAIPALARANNVAAVLSNIDTEYDTVVRALKGTLFGRQVNNGASTSFNGGTNANWNIDLNVYGTGLDWTGFQNIEGAIGLSPDFGFTTN
ncbi:hypothetical protein K435DRAFT_835156 [Dendrothele bispora CBS 962.96]|uniref:Zn(2)-C6 fungal-type domain-containing protein n=1 Tax=Dendrothele bispora (strain CBS 962.96) TaxID=1314807 RepID=A0A4S8MPG4_DENBC|nr:hypothetical protein K435DRAFT_835156 [Dendrothele bispora CBS 962.96]